MTRLAIAALAFAILICTALATADDKTTLPAGSWKRTDVDPQVYLTISAKKVEVRLLKKDAGTTIIDIASTYQNGVLSGKVSRVRVFKKKFDTGLKSGDAVSFKINVEADGKAAVSDVKGKDGAAANETAQKILEGKYKKINIPKGK